MNIMDTKIGSVVSLLLLMSGVHVQAKITALPMIEIKKRMHKYSKSVSKQKYRV